jgi:putative intracellular protease/amidase
MEVLFVLTSHHQLGKTGRKTGFWLEELAAPYYVFKNAGAEVTLASPKGGQPPLDPKSNEPKPAFLPSPVRQRQTDARGRQDLRRYRR